MRSNYKRSKGQQYDGEPRLIMGANGTTIEIRGGQPVCDAGVENAIQISLFTKPGWFGNHFLPAEFRVGDCDFDNVMTGSITASTFTHAEKEAKRGLKWMIDDRIISEVNANVSNPNGIRVDADIETKRPDGTIEQINVRRYGGTWIRQCDDPASQRLTSDGAE